MTPAPPPTATMEPATRRAYSLLSSRLSAFAYPDLFYRKRRERKAFVFLLSVTPIRNFRDGTLCVKIFYTDLWETEAERSRNAFSFLQSAFFFSRAGLFALEFNRDVYGKLLEQMETPHRISNFPRNDCTSRGGVADGSCASGFGVCCYCESPKACSPSSFDVQSLFHQPSPAKFSLLIFSLPAVKYQCGSTTSENGTYFANPTSTNRICNLMINRLNDQICQV